MHPLAVIIHQMTQAATIIHHRPAAIGKMDNAMILITLVGREFNVKRLMATFIVTTQDVICLTITVLTLFILTKDVTTIHQRLMTAVHADYLMVLCILIHAITTQATVRSLCFSPVMANAMKIRLK